VANKRNPTYQINMAAARTMRAGGKTLSAITRAFGGSRDSWRIHLTHGNWNPTPTRTYNKSEALGPDLAKPRRVDRPCLGWCGGTVEGAEDDPSARFCKVCRRNKDVWSGAGGFL